MVMATSIVKGLRAASEPEALANALSAVGLALEQVGLEACLLTVWLYDGLRAAGWPHLVPENERSDHLPTRRRQRPADLEAADIAGAGHDDLLNGVTPARVAWDRVVTVKLAHRNLSVE
jgi:hypothetical protein